MREGVPLIVPDVNAEVIRAEHRLFPVANCTAIVLCTALRPIRDAAGLRSVHVATYQAASGAGTPGHRRAHRRRSTRSRAAKPSRRPRSSRVRSRETSCRRSGRFDADGWSGEERKVCDETRKLLDLPDLRVSVIAVRVPVLTAHSEAVFVETQRDATSVEKLARGASKPRPASSSIASGIVTPREVEGTDDVHVARLRAESAKRDFALWCVGDQLRRGAATNAVQILELLLRKGYVAA